MTEKQISQSKKHFGYQVINRVQHKITGLFMRSYNQRGWWFGKGFTQSPNYNKKNYTVVEHIAIPIEDIIDNTAPIPFEEIDREIFMNDHGVYLDREFPKHVKNYNRSRVEFVKLDLLAGSSLPIYYYVKYNNKYYNFVTRGSNGERRYDSGGLSEVEVVIQCTYEFSFKDNNNE